MDALSSSAIRYHLPTHAVNSLPSLRHFESCTTPRFDFSRKEGFHGHDVFYLAALLVRRTSSADSGSMRNDVLILFRSNNGK